MTLVVGGMLTQTNLTIKVPNMTTADEKICDILLVLWEKQDLIFYMNHSNKA